MSVNVFVELKILLFDIESNTFNVLVKLLDVLGIVSLIVLRVRVCLIQRISMCVLLGMDLDIVITCLYRLRAVHYCHVQVLEP